MDYQRRKVLHLGGGLGLWGVLATAGLITPEFAVAEWNKNAFDAKDMNSVLSSLSATNASQSAKISLSISDIAENGAIVPVGISASLPSVDMVAILVEKNPTPLAAIFKFPEGTPPEIQTRCKMGQTSYVYALVRSEGKFYTAKKEVKVTLGGCGG